jgi:hypothetical protein
MRRYTSATGFFFKYSPGVFGALAQGSKPQLLMPVRLGRLIGTLMKWPSRSLAIILFYFSTDYLQIAFRK